MMEVNEQGIKIKAIAGERNQRAEFFRQFAFERIFLLFEVES
jgi:hypothetical protein